MLYKHHNYLNKDIPYLISEEIVEYDMKEAGFNIIKKYGLLDKETIARLDRMSKEERKIRIGLMQRKDRELGRKLNEGFVEVRKDFFEANQIQDEDVLSIKKDAIFTTRRNTHLDFGQLQFAEKHIYTSYYYLNDKEFYFNKEGIDVKGISDERLVLHKEYMLDFLFNFFTMMEVSSSRKKPIELIVDFSNYYKKRQLQKGYYRELNRQSLYHLLEERLFDERIGIEDVGNVDKVDISYNYVKYIVPLISILV